MQKKDAVIANLQREIRNLERQLREVIADGIGLVQMANRFTEQNETDMHGRIGDWWKTEATYSRWGLILWLKKAAEDKVYCYDEHTKCSSAQYFAAVASPIACWQYLGDV